MNALANRRDFLKQIALLLPASLLGLRSEKASALMAPIKRVGGAHLRPALNIYSFNEILLAHARDVQTGLDLFSVCDFAAKQDFDAVDLTGYFFPGYPKAPPDSYLYQLKRHVHDLGLDLSGTGVRNDFVAADPAIRAEGVKIVKDWIEVAAKLGAPTIRVFADSQPPFKNWQAASGHAHREAVEAWAADALRECAAHARKFGIIVAVQNHGDFISTGEQHLSLINRVDHEWCAPLVDIGKYLTKDPYADIALVAPYAVNWQIKQAMDTLPNATRTDLVKLVTLIRHSGYRGYLPIETLPLERKDYDPFMEVPQFLTELREAIRKTSSIAPFD